LWDDREVYHCRELRGIFNWEAGIQGPILNTILIDRIVKLFSNQKNVRGVREMPKYQELYQEKLCAVVEAIKLVQDGDFIVVPTGVGEPPALLRLYQSIAEPGGGSAGVD
jgi:hypothetical protein